MAAAGPRSNAASGESTGGEDFRLSLRRPQQLSKPPPCQLNCPGTGDIRGWVGIIAQREKLGLSMEEACERAWQTLVARNPFPATMGGLSHPCEAAATERIGRRGGNQCPRAFLETGASSTDWRCPELL
jgi:hypothetical protein